MAVSARVCTVAPTTAARAAPQNGVAPSPRAPAQQLRQAPFVGRSAGLIKAQKAAGPQVATRSVAQESGTGSSVAVGQHQWYGLLSSAEFYFNDVQNEALAEQLRELKRYYGEQNRELDFFFVCEPAWLEQKFPAEAKKCRRPAVALVSTDQQWITFMKLRLDRVMKIDMGSMDIATATTSTAEIPEFKLSDGTWRAPYTPYAPGWWETFMRK